jgi:hypothetical protein
MKIPRWLRIAMLTTAVMNLLGAISFLPAAGALRTMGGLPSEAHPLYLTTIAVFIFVFGAAYLWIGMTGKADRQFVAVVAAGKLCFFGVLVWYAVTGAIPAQAATSGVGDLIFGSLFLFWLLRRSTPKA